MLLSGPRILFVSAEGVLSRLQVSGGGRACQCLAAGMVGRTVRRVSVGSKGAWLDCAAGVSG